MSLEYLINNHAYILLWLRNNLIHIVIYLCTSTIISAYICTAKGMSNRPSTKSKLMPSSTSTQKTSLSPSAATPTGQHDALGNKIAAGKTPKMAPIVHHDIAKTQDDEDPISRFAKKEQQSNKAPNDVANLQKKAADDGVVVPPSLVKHMGNIDEIAQTRKAQLEKDMEAMKSDNDKSKSQIQSTKADPKLKVRINEKNCVLYETNDLPTLDEQDDENAIADLY
ncbi:unnamed protein product [Cylicocyclus nassatus]|uniref:Uncharacterized protein n=1 Tax=Cylicocyclus nassatus TaxID=53992 RepID=A0AA36H9L4_CYLNA|nr:unnamed protein product [Cylicocyclus nassatus]